jgi:hypothetical protein
VSDDRLARLVQLREAEDKIIRSLVRDELAATIPGLQEIKDQRRDDLDAAEKALAGPQEEIRRLKAEIAEGEETRAKLTEDISGPFGERVARRAQVVAADEELAELRAELSRANGVAGPLLQARENARRSFEKAADDLRMRETNLLLPYLDAGQDTMAYVEYRQGSGWLTEVLLAGGPGHPEREAAFQQLDVLAMASGYRTENRKDVPDDASRAKLHWDAVFDSYSHDPGSGGSLDTTQTARANSFHETTPAPPTPGRNGPGAPSLLRQADQAAAVANRWVG